jgi:uncharacterized membrane protein YheB (UPF0754 family)
MIDEQYSNLVTAYLDGSISTEQEKQLHKLIDTGEIRREDLEKLEQLYSSMEHLPAPEPSEKMHNRFYQMLAEEQNRNRFSLSEKIRQFTASFQLRQLAAAIGILLVGMLVGNWQTPFHDYRHQLDRLSSEVSQMRQMMMLNLLDNDSATERLKAVNISTEMQSTDDRVAHALLKTLNNDPNVNVRLAAIEALLHHASNPEVREGLVDSIARQDSPIVQAALADAMLILQEKRSVEEFQKLLDRNGLDHTVRDKLKNTITALS